MKRKLFSLFLAFIAMIVGTGGAMAQSTAYQLTSIQFSNSAYGSITEPVAASEGVEARNGTITVPYMAGEDAPTVNLQTLKVSDGAFVEVFNTEVLYVEDKDGTKKATYDIIRTPITPITVSSDIETTEFTEVPSWVYNPYGYDATKGVKFAKAVDDASNMRIAKGNTRQYYFIGAAQTLTLTSMDAARAINVYVNGVKDESITTTAKKTDLTITLSQTQNNMVCIESNQTGGDGGFTAYAVTAAATTAPVITTDLEATTTASINVAKTLSIEATGADTYQWYTCDDADKTNAAAISGATAASYDYTATAAGTAYLYCVASNANGDTPSTVCAVTATDGPSYPITSTWAFDSYGKYGESSTGFQYQKNSGTVASSNASVVMDVDATNGKLSTRASDTQWNANTILKVPVTSPKDKIYVKAKSNAYTVGGVAATDAEATYNVSYASADAGYVEIVATANTYLYTITLTQNEPNTTTPELNSFTVNGTKYYPGDMSSTPTDVSVDILTYATMISSENPLTDVDAVCGTVGTITYNVAADNNSCVATIPVSLEGAETVNYTVTVNRLQTVDITYYDTDGTTILAVKTVDAGTAIGEFPTPTAIEGKTFRGWYDANAEGATEITSETVANDYMSVYAVATTTEVATATSHIAYDLRVKTFNPAFHDLMAINGTYSFNGTQHGIQLGSSNTIDLTVGGPAYIILGSCKYSSGNYTLTGCDAQSAKVTTDGDNVVFHYTGEAGTISLGFTGTTYIHTIDVYNTASTIEKNAAGYYEVAANDASSLALSIMQANKETGSKVFVPNGTYDLGSDLSGSNSSAVKSGMTISGATFSLIGESQDGVIIKATATADNEAINASTVQVTGNSFYAQDLTLSCYAGYNTTRKAERASALWNRAQYSTLKNVYLKGTQDTYYTNYSSAGQYSYYVGGKIEGTVDFICGAGNHYFDGVNLYCTNSSTASKTTGDYITAPNTYASETGGYVFKNAVIDGESSQNGTFYLGRAWNNEPRCTYINRTSNITPATALWTDMSGFTGTKHFADVTDETGYEISTVLGDWATTAQTEATQATVSNVAFINNTMSWNGSADAYLIEDASGNFVAITADKTYAGGAVGYTVRAANARGGFGEAVAATSGVTVAINAKGYGTFSCAYPVQITGAKVYKATLNTTDNTIKCTEITSGKVPAGNGVLLYKEGVTVATTATASYVETADAIDGNDLKATTLADGSLATLETSLALSGDTFMNYTGTAFKPGKAYFPYTKTENAKTFTIVFDGDETTAINAVESANVNNGAAYNLAGQRVNANAKGIVIINGKKYINK